MATRAVIDHWIARHFLLEQRNLIYSPARFAVVVKHARLIGASEAVAAAAVSRALARVPQFIVSGRSESLAQSIGAHLAILRVDFQRSHSSIVVEGGAGILLFAPANAESRMRGMRGDVWLDEPPVDFAGLHDLLAATLPAVTPLTGRCRIVVPSQRRALAPSGPPWVDLHLRGVGIETTSPLVPC